MNKVHVMISIDEDLKKRGKENLINFSAICEDAIMKKLNMKINAEEEDRQCHYCSNKGEVWDGLLEFWVCKGCCNREIKKVSIMGKK